MIAKIQLALEGITGSLISINSDCTYNEVEFFESYVKIKYAIFMRGCKSERVTISITTITLTCFLKF